MNGVVERGKSLPPENREPKKVPSRRVTLNHEERLTFIREACSKVENQGLPDIKGWRKGKKIFDQLDFEKLAKNAGEMAEGDFAGPALAPSEIVDAILAAIQEKEVERLKGGLVSALVTTNHILFEFYLLKRTFGQLMESAK